MLISVLKGKIHRAIVTEHNLDYEGSLTIDRVLMDRAGLVPYERISVWNVSNGERFDTYVIEGEAASGVICVNGAAARRASTGDVVIIAAFGLIKAGETVPAPFVVRVDGANRPLADDSAERAR